MPEQVGGIVGILHFTQPPVIGAEGGKGQVAVSVAIPSDIVDVNPAGGIGLKGRPQVPSPLDMNLRLPRIFPN